MPRAGTDQSGCGGVQDTVAFCILEETCVSSIENLDMERDNDEEEGFAASDEESEEERKLMEEEQEQKDIIRRFYVDKRDELMDKLMAQQGMTPMINFDHCNACHYSWVGLESRFALRVIEEL